MPDSEDALNKIMAALLSRRDPANLAEALYEEDEDAVYEDADDDDEDDPFLQARHPLGLYSDSYAVDRAADRSRHVMAQKDGSKKPLSPEEAMDRLHSDFAENYLLFVSYWLEGNDPGPRPEGCGRREYDEDPCDDDYDKYDEVFGPLLFGQVFRRQLKGGPAFKGGESF